MDDGFRDHSSRNDDEPLTLVTDGSRTNRTKWARLDALIDPECVLYVGYLGDHVVHIRREDEGEPNFHLDFTCGHIRLVKLKYRRLQPPVPVSEADFILFMDDYMADRDADVYRFFKHGERAVVEDDRPLNERWLERFMRGVDQDTHLLQRKIGDDTVDFIRHRPAAAPAHDAHQRSVGISVATPRDRSSHHEAECKNRTGGCPLDDFKPRTGTHDATLVVK